MPCSSLGWPSTPESRRIRTLSFVSIRLKVATELPTIHSLSRQPSKLRPLASFTSAIVNDRHVSGTLCAGGPNPVFYSFMTTMVTSSCCSAAPIQSRT